MFCCADLTGDAASELGEIMPADLPIDLAAELGEITPIDLAGDLTGDLGEIIPNDLTGDLTGELIGDGHVGVNGLDLTSRSVGLLGNVCNPRTLNIVSYQKREFNYHFFLGVLRSPSLRRPLRPPSLRLSFPFKCSTFPTCHSSLAMSAATPEDASM